MIPFFVLLAGALLTTPSKSVAGDTKGNGGDSIHCAQSSENSFIGVYNLDFLVTYNKSNENADVVPVSSWRESSLRIAAELEKKAPLLALSFREFLKHEDNFSDYSQKRIWEGASFGLVDLKDEALQSQVPKNCGVDESAQQNSGLKLIQTVNRVQHHEKIIYLFDGNIFARQKTERPLQFSFLMVHEWLRDITNNPFEIRRINRWLHSRSLSDSNSEELKHMFESILNRSITIPLKEGVYKTYGEFTSLNCDYRLEYSHTLAMKMTAINCRNPIFSPEELEHKFLSCSPNSDHQHKCFQFGGNAPLADRFRVIGSGEFHENYREPSAPNKFYKFRRVRSL